MINLKSLFTGAGGREPVTNAKLSAAYEQGPSFTDLLPWAEYIPECQQILLIDGYTRMACYELVPIASEGRTREYLESVADNVAAMLSETLPENGEDPWVVQFFVNNEPDLESHLDRVKGYIAPEIWRTEFTQAWWQVYQQHIGDVTRPEGYFEDEAVTGAIWRGQSCSVRMVIYRKYAQNKPVDDPELELTDICDKCESNLAGVGIKFRRMNGEDFYWWMLLWFNPRPPSANGNVANLHTVAPYPGDEDLPIGSDLAEILTLSRPEADEKKGYLYFDGMPHAALQIVNCKTLPRPGHLTGEKANGSTMMDKFPEGCVLSYTLTVMAQDEVTKRITIVSDRAIGETAESRQKYEKAQAVLNEQASGDKLYALEMVVYVRGDNDRDIKRKLEATNTLLTMNGLTAIPVSKEVVPLDNYIKNLPGVYTPFFDQKARRKAKPYFVSHAAALAPIYGRSRGSNNPGLFFFNRSGEPTMVDPLNYNDRSKSAHGLVFGPTGSGKSATLIWQLSCLFAVHRPKLFVIESGNSFGLWADWAERHGATVAKNKLSMDSDLSIPPFANALRLLSSRVREEIELIDEEASEDDDEVKRDYLGEMELTAQIMVTGGDKSQVLSRAQRLALRYALVESAEQVSAEYGPDGIVIPSDVKDALKRIANRDEFKHHASQILEMSYAMELFTDGLNGHLFNRREGELWADVDIQLVDLAQAVGEGAGSTLAVGYVSLLQDINARIELDQMESRFTLVLTDEAHLIYTDDLLPAIVMKAIKQWRKLGAFLWLATQNIDDYPDTSQRLLNMMEFWLCLAMPKDEVDKISQFRDLTTEERQMMVNCVKSPQRYVEGVLLSDKQMFQFRNVPPSLFLALAQTEKHEKSVRGDLMKQRQLTGRYAELDSACIVAEQIRESRLEAMS